MSAKKLRAAHEPSWTEVTIGAVLSVVLGVALGAILLVLKPVAAVKEMPKEADRVSGTIYYVEGSRDSGKARQAAVKRKQFAQGGSVTVTEDEINSFITPPPPMAVAKPKPAEKPKAGDKAAPAPAATAPASDMFSIASPNFRIRDGVVQLAVPVTISVFGFDQRVIVLAKGNFVKKGEVFAFDPDTLYFGSCPMQRLPFAAGFVANKFFASQPVPDDIAKAWPKLAAVTVDGNALKLTMP